jgi:hypothetical protein
MARLDYHRAIAWAGLALLVTFAVSLSISQSEEGFVPLFNGKDLTGWEGDTKLWVVENGELVGRSPGIKYNDFLATIATYEDFILKARFKLVDKSGHANSGIQYRSRRVPNSHEVSGYQADIGQNYWGCLYDESRRNKVLVQAPKELARVLKKDDWNEYVIRCEGHHIIQELNGFKTVDYIEKDPSIARRGILALQIHSGGPMEIHFKDMRIKTLDKK